MNDKQKIASYLVGAILILMLFYPPFHIQYGLGANLNVGYGFILDPPKPPAGYKQQPSSVNVSMLLIQYLIVVTVGGLIIYSLKDKK